MFLVQLMATKEQFLFCALLTWFTRPNRKEYQFVWVIHIGWALKYEQNVLCWLAVVSDCTGNRACLFISCHFQQDCQVYGAGQNSSLQSNLNWDGRLLEWPGHWVHRRVMKDDHRGWHNRHDKVSISVEECLSLCRKETVAFQNTLPAEYFFSSRTVQFHDHDHLFTFSSPGLMLRDEKQIISRSFNLDLLEV